MSKPIAYEANALTRLAAEGYTGGAELLRKLATKGETLRQRYENGCCYQWATTEAYEAGSDKLERQITKLATDAGLMVYIQGDPRGATVYVCGPNGTMTRNNYSTFGICCYRN